MTETNKAVPPTKTGPGGKPLEEKPTADANTHGTSSDGGKEAPKPADKPAPAEKSKVEDKAPETPSLELPDDPGPPETISDEEADALDAAHGGETARDDSEHGSVDAGVLKEYNGAAVRVHRLTDQLAGKKDNFTIYGYGGVLITLGDLRALLGPYDHNRD